MPTFGRDRRLTHARQFQAVYAAKVRRSRGVLAVSGAPNGVGRARLGLAVGVRVGNAAKRARAKRLIREAFRLSQDDLPPGLDLVVSVRGPTPPHFDLHLLREALVEMAASIAREWERRP